MPPLHLDQPRVVAPPSRIVSDRGRRITLFVIAIFGGLVLYTSRHKIPINISWGLGNQLPEQDDIYAKLCKRAAENAYLPGVGKVFDDVIYTEVDPKNPSLCQVQAGGVYPPELSWDSSLAACTLPISDDEKNAFSRRVNVTAKPFKQVEEKLEACFEINAIDL